MKVIYPYLHILQLFTHKDEFFSSIAMLHFAEKFLLTPVIFFILVF